MKVARGADPELNKVSISSFIFREISNRQIWNKVKIKLLNPIYKFMCTELSQQTVGLNF